MKMWLLLSLSFGMPGCLFIALIVFDLLDPDREIDAENKEVLEVISPPQQEAVMEDIVAEDIVVEDIAVEDIVVEDIAVEDIVAEDIAVEDIVAEDIVVEDAVAQAPSSEMLKPVTVDAQVETFNLTKSSTSKRATCRQ
jgi:hypothetical protein